MWFLFYILRCFISLIYSAKQLSRAADEELIRSTKFYLFRELINQPKYLDNAATTPVDPRVKEAMLPYFDEIFGNASSNHVYGKEAKRAIETARGHVANIINADSKEIYFTSGATEAINWALKGYLEANPEKGNHIITVTTEHKAVLKTCEYLESKGYEVTYLNVDKNGLISLEDLKGAIKETTALISVMFVNNETGIIQDIQAIGEIARENDVCFFCDASQAVGKIAVSVSKENIDMLCISGHKMKGPKGVGALYVKSGVKLESLMHGGGQENGMRGGTYNTPGIVGFGEACRISLEEFGEHFAQLNTLRKEWQAYFEEKNIGIINFRNVKTAPHILSITLNKQDAEDFLIMKAKELAAATGSACNASIMDVSHVVKALRLKPYSLIRISLNA